MEETIYQSIVKIQSKLKAPKGQFNKFGNYKYRSCEDIVEAVKPLISEEGCYLIMRDEIVTVGERIYVKATAAIYKGKEYITACAFAREPSSQKGMSESQLTGAASSYARKYALNGLLCIDDTKDADTMEAPMTIDEKQLSQILDILDNLENPKEKKEKFLKYMDVQKIEHIKTSDFNKAMNALKSAKKRGEK